MESIFPSSQQRQPSALREHNLTDLLFGFAPFALVHGAIIFGYFYVIYRDAPSLNKPPAGSGMDTIFQYQDEIFLTFIYISLAVLILFVSLIILGVSGWKRRTYIGWGAITSNIIPIIYILLVLVKSRQPYT